MDKPSRAQYSPTDFLVWRENKLLNITPKFQRRGVWSSPQRSYFIDTLLRQMPVPPIYLRNVFQPSTGTSIHEVIDGQQRLKSVLEYMDDSYAISKTVDSPFSGKKFSTLPVLQKNTIRNFRFNCEVFDDITDIEVLEVFRRMNTYAAPLTKQELRHGRFFGAFSQSSHALSLQYLEFWRANKIVSEKKIARMVEVQFTSSLLIAMIDGLQDKNDSIDSFYTELDGSRAGLFLRELDKTVMPNIRRIEWITQQLIALASVIV